MKESERKANAQTLDYGRRLPPRRTRGLSWRRVIVGVIIASLLFIFFFVFNAMFGEM